MTHILMKAFGLLEHLWLDEFLRVVNNLTWLLLFLRLRNDLVTSAKPAKSSVLLKYHSSDYIELLKVVSEKGEEDIDDDLLEEHGLGYDCELYEGVYDDAAAIVGASLAASQLLTGQSRNQSSGALGHSRKRPRNPDSIESGDTVAADIDGPETKLPSEVGRGEKHENGRRRFIEADYCTAAGGLRSVISSQSKALTSDFSGRSVNTQRRPEGYSPTGEDQVKLKSSDAEGIHNAPVSINWCGGWHHATRFQASGYCYFNDIVIGIVDLLTRFKRVLYIDLDLHHGNGVEEAFYNSKSVFTFSVHKYAAGFFPGTGAFNNIGAGKGIGYCCNMPMKEGYNDFEFDLVFRSIVPAIYERFRPDCVVCQCGGDALSTDPHVAGNLTTSSYRRAVKLLANDFRNVPLMLLGGGGYNLPDTAKLWTMLTADVLGITLDNDIPDNEMMDSFAPYFSLVVEAGNRKSFNDIGDLERMISVAVQRISQLPCPATTDSSYH